MGGALGTPCPRALLQIGCSQPVSCFYLLGVRADEIEFCGLEKLTNPLCQPSCFFGVTEAQEARQESQMTSVVCMDGSGLEPVAQFPTLWMAPGPAAGTCPAPPVCTAWRA